MWEAEFYSAGSPATAKRYRYVFGTASYDALNRLKSADYSFYSSGWQSTLAHDLAGIGYDLAGNITALQRYRETGSLIDNLTYSNATTSNRLNSVSDAVGATTETWDAETGSFTYDANGNLKTAPAPYAITAVTYDHQNLALSLTSAGTTKTYRYNEAGQRITKQLGTGNTEVYLLDGMSSLGVFTVNGSGSVVSSYFNVLAGDKVVGRQPGTGNRRYYHTDLLGSTRAVVEGATVVESYDFEPWGLLMPGRTLAGPTKEGFTGKEQDAETGLDYFGARYYMPALARWTSVDPMSDSFPEWNPYNYVLNNPTKLTDPFGLCPPQDENVNDCLDTPLGNAWRALNETKTGRSVITGYVRRFTSVIVREVDGGQVELGTCEGNARGCGTHHNDNVTVRSDLEAGAIAFTLVHENSHVEAGWVPPNSEEGVQDEAAAWDSSIKFYNELRGPYKEQAKKEYGAEVRLFRSNRQGAMQGWRCERGISKTPC